MLFAAVTRPTYGLSLEILLNNNNINNNNDIDNR
jgi:hypothetical protein